jgi:ATP-binding cassette subfamily B protein
MKIKIKTYFKFLLRYLDPLKLQVVLLGLVLAFNVSLQLIMPRILGNFIDLAKGGASLKILVSSAVLFIGAAIAQQLLALISTYTAQIVGWKSTNQLRMDLVEKFLELDMSFHKSYKQGEMIEKIDGDVTALFNFFSKLIPGLVNNVVLMICVLIMLFREGILIGTPMTIFAASALFIFMHIQKKAVPVWVENREATSEFYGLLGENINGAEDIRSSAAVGYFIQCYHKFIKRLYKVQLKSELMFCRMFSSSLLLFAIGGALSLGIGGYLWRKGVISIGTVYIIFNYTELLRRPIEQIRGQMEDLQRAGASIKRTEELLNTKSLLLYGTEEIAHGEAAAVEAKNICFCYEEGSQVLNNISFRLPKGKKLGILGRTGSGKTTLARLIARLYDPESGEIRLGQINIKDLTLQNLREHVAYITQDVQVFCATVRDNITLFDPQIKDEQILKIINDIGLNSWYRRLQDGLDTILQSEGGGLSAGEAQLLAIARGFLKNPSLVIMDEASARLDPASEHLLDNALKKLLKDRTCIIIAHRLSTVERADDILILEAGNVIEYGNREELLRNKDSRLCDLLRKGIEEVLV